ncbi:uncharacterized protein LOC143223527 [Tachypleus tridentatus]|uniref:uncharacterized protein LOC143223527 n=1 Tax=Tachypleus tridentatus TaxID=6853 RepID=UPI003FD4A1B9
MVFYRLILFVIVVMPVRSGPVKLPVGKEVTQLDQKTAPSYVKEVKAQLIPVNTEQSQPATDVQSSPELVEIKTSKNLKANGIAEKLLEGLIDKEGEVYSVDENSYKLRYIVDDGRFRKFRNEEKTAEGQIVGELGIHHGNGVIRGVQYTASADVHPKLLYETLVKFLSL